MPPFSLPCYKEKEFVFAIPASDKLILPPSTPPVSGLFLRLLVGISAPPLKKNLVLFHYTVTTTLCQEKPRLLSTALLKVPLFRREAAQQKGLRKRKPFCQHIFRCLKLFCALLLRPSILLVCRRSAARAPRKKSAEKP
ncbi:MAG: hypothetical protein IIX61_00970 [Loktanella sp.]|nr:hypothetical protein [Loktanella sp.]